MRRNNPQLPASPTSNTASPIERDDSAKSPAVESKEELYSILHGPFAVALALSEINTKGDHFGSAAVHLRKLRENLKPRDAIEEMLVEQLAVTHARVVKLSGQAVIQRNEVWYRTISEACDRAANTFRRLTVAFREYREPRRTTVMAIQQANVANQQVVQQISPAKEQLDGGKTPVQSVPERQAITSDHDQKESAVATIDRSENDAREDSLKHERVQARNAKRDVRRRAKQGA